MKIKKGDKIRVEYEGRLESGEVFDSSSHGSHSHPLSFEVGAGQMIKGFDEGVMDMELDSEKEITIPPEEAYGEFTDMAIREVPRKIFGENNIEAGMQIALGDAEGHQFPAKILEVGQETVKVDLNHPLAGKTLIFKIKVIAINDEGDLEEHDHHGHHH